MNADASVVCRGSDGDLAVRYTGLRLAADSVRLADVRVAVGRLTLQGIPGVPSELPGGLWPTIVNARVGYTRRFIVLLRPEAHNTAVVQRVLRSAFKVDVEVHREQPHGVPVRTTNPLMLVMNSVAGLAEGPATLCGVELEIDELRVVDVQTTAIGRDALQQFSASEPELRLGWVWQTTQPFSVTHNKRTLKYDPALAFLFRDGYEQTYAANMKDGEAALDPNRHLMYCKLIASDAVSVSAEGDARMCDTDDDRQPRASLRVEEPLPGELLAQIASGECADGSELLIRQRVGVGGVDELLSEIKFRQDLAEGSTAPDPELELNFEDEAVQQQRGALPTLQLGQPLPDNLPTEDLEAARCFLEQPSSTTYTSMPLLPWLAQQASQPHLRTSSPTTVSAGCKHHRPAPRSAVAPSPTPSCTRRCISSAGRMGRCISRLAAPTPNSW